MIPEHEKKLMRVFDPYIVVGKKGAELSEDATEEAKQAFAEFRKLVEEEKKHHYDPDWF